MMLSIKDVEHIAHLARITLTEEEKAYYAKDLSAIFGYIDMLNDVDVSGVAETCQVTGLEDVIRKDEVNACDEETRKKLIESFPDKLGALLKVKGVFTASDE